MGKPTAFSWPVKLFSLLLAMAMALSLTGLPAAAADESLTVDNTQIDLFENAQTYTATLTADKPDGSDAWTSAEWTSWAADLTWSLTRTQEEFAADQDAEIYPTGYTGDTLQNWVCWTTTADSEPYFKLAAPKVDASGEKALVTQSFTNTPFFGTAHVGEDDLMRLLSANFVGTYHLTVSDGETELGSADMEVTLYDGYTLYGEEYDTLCDIAKLAEEHGRYFAVDTYGYSEDGRAQYYAVLADSEKTVDDWKTMNETALTDPASLQQKIQDGTLDYRVTYMLNNVHPNEFNCMDASLELLRTLATQDTVTYNTLAGLKKDGKTEWYESADGTLDLGNLFAADIVDLGITGLGSQKLTKPSAEEDPQNNTFTNDASELYEISADQTLDVNKVLQNIIFVVSPTENPDGRANNDRPNGQGFDLNRDAANQTQNETRGLSALINAWNPVVFAELHGFMSEFLCEPCTPPHEPNMEYDILVKNFALGAEACKSAALGTMSKQYQYEDKFWSCYTPLLDDYDPQTMTWSAWDDLCTNYGPSYAMLNCGSLGYTIETPCANDASTKLLECGQYGMIQYVVDNKDDLYTNQLEFFRRGVENIDARDQMDSWYVDVSNKALDPDTWRVPYAENDNFFPEYYVIPVDSASQRDVADAYFMAEYLQRNGVQVSALTEDVKVGAQTCKAGSFVVDMYQAKRNIANAVLWTGEDASASGFPELYSESVSNFPQMRGFTCLAVATPGAFDGKLEAVETVKPVSNVAGEGGIAILSNNGQEAVRAVNALLADGVSVGLITEGANRDDFVLAAADLDSVSDYTLDVTLTDKMPTAYEIRQPQVYIAGGFEPYATMKIADPDCYYYQWFADDLAYADADNYSWGNRGYLESVYAFGGQLDFALVTDPAEADVILDAMPADSGSWGEQTITAIQGGTPYIAWNEAIDYVCTTLLGGAAQMKSLGMEALHNVAYPADSLVTASYVSDKDTVMYSYNCQVFTKLPDDAQILIQAADKNSLIAGCCLNEDGTPLDGLPEAVALSYQGMDLTLFANSVCNRTHQQDDYRYVTNAIYSKCLAAEPMTIG